MMRVGEERRMRKNRETIPGALTTEQAGMAWGEGHWRSGEWRLAYAVMEEFLLSWAKGMRARVVVVSGERERELRGRWAEDVAWLESEDESYIYSFRSLCAILDLDADAVRAHVKAWKLAMGAHAGRKGFTGQQKGLALGWYRGMRGAGRGMVGGK